MTPMEVRLRTVNAARIIFFIEMLRLQSDELPGFNDEWLDLFETDDNPAFPHCIYAPHSEMDTAQLDVPPTRLVLHHPAMAPTRRWRFAMATEVGIHPFAAINQRHGSRACARRDGAKGPGVSRVVKEATPLKASTGRAPGADRFGKGPASSPPSQTDVAGPPARDQSIAAWTRFATRSRRAECHGSGLWKFVR